MGLIRKSVSLSTFGLLDFRSDKERIARNTKKGYKATQLQTRVIATAAEQSYAQNAAQLAQLTQQSTYLRAMFLQTPAGQAQLADAHARMAAAEQAWQA